MWDCLHQSIPLISALIQDLLPGEVIPLGRSVLLHLLNAALYSELINQTELMKKNLRFAEATPAKETLSHKSSISSFDGTINTPEAIHLAIAEALCSMDEDNKHTEEINDILSKAADLLEGELNSNEGCKRVENSIQMCEILTSDLLETNEGKNSLKVCLIPFYIQFAFI